MMNERFAAPTRIVEGPVSQTVNVGDAVVLSCSAVTDQYETLTLEWRRDGVPVDFSRSTHVGLDDDDHSLIIDSAVVIDTAQYTCHAGNGLDQVDSPPATLTVRGLQSPCIPRTIVTSMSVCLSVSSSYSMVQRRL